jgi:hypothetical protein
MFLVLNGAVVLLVGLLSGAPMGSAINKRKGEDIVRGWRVAHSGLVMGGIMLLGIASIIPKLALSEGAAATLALAFFVSSVGFTVALPLGAWKQHRGLKPKPSGINTLVYLGNIVGAWGSVIGTLIVIVGAWNGLRG